MVTVNVRYSRSWKTVKTHELLGSCSQGTFVFEKLLQDLRGNEKKTPITTKNGEVNYKVTMVEELKVSNSRDEGGEWIDLSKIFTKSYLQVDEGDIATPSKLKQWKYFKSMMDKINKRDYISVGLLNDVNCPKALEPFKIILAGTMFHIHSKKDLGGAL